MLICIAMFRIFERKEVPSNVSRRQIGLQKFPTAHHIIIKTFFFTRLQFRSKSSQNSVEFPVAKNKLDLAKPLQCFLRAVDECFEAAMKVLLPV